MCKQKSFYDNKGKEIIKILQENYEIETAQDLSGAIKDLFKDALQQMMNAEFDTSMEYSKYDKKTEKIIEIVLQKRV